MNRKGRVVIPLVAALALAVFWRAIADGTHYQGDILQAQYPLRSVYAAELERGSLPLWTTLLYGGYPLLAEGQLGALYPPNLILHASLPVAVALKVFILAHLVWAALGAYAFARRLGAHRLAASAVGLLHALAGYLVVHLTDVNVVACSSWLPWLFLLADRLVVGAPAGHRARSAALLALALGMVSLAGQPQIAALSLAAILVYVVYVSWATGQHVRVVGLGLAALLLGVALAAAQLLPSYELAQLPASPGGVDSGTPASSSVQPRDLASLLSPFVLDTPSAQPGYLSFLQSRTGVYRIYTQEKAAPSPSVMREPYYPSLSLSYGLPMANGLLPHVPPRYAKYTSEMTGNMLNLLGVKYYLIPQVPPVGGTDESYDLDDPFAYNPVEQTSVSRMILIAAFEVDSYLTDAADVSNGQLVALISVLPQELDEVMDFGLVAGGQTAEWAYDRSDLRKAVRHGKPVSAREFPARSGIPPEDHPGYVYHARFTLPYSILTQGIYVFAYVPPADLHIERITLIDEQGKRYLLSHMQGSNDHTLVYLSGDVAIFENHDVLPRIFLTYAARAVPDDAEALAILRSREFDPRQEVLLAAEQTIATQRPTEGAERVELTSYDSRRVVASVVAPADGYLVLTDAWYPGWKVRVDGQEVALLRADVLFRAVHLTAGEHTVEFTYAPASFRTGLLVSALALLLVFGLYVLDGKHRGQRD